MCKLKQTRVAKGIKQKEMAKLLGITTPSYSKKENNKIALGTSELKQIKSFLKLTDEEFIEIFFDN